MERYLLLYMAVLFEIVQTSAKSDRKNDLNVSKTSPVPVAFWPIRTSLHEHAYNSGRRYATINGSSISVPGVYNTGDFGYVPIDGSSSIDIENSIGDLNGIEAMTWIFYVRMSTAQSAVLLQYSYKGRQDFTFGLVDQNNLYISCTDDNENSHYFKSQLTIPDDGQWFLIGFTFNKLWTNDDHIDIMQFQNPDDNPATETFGMGNLEVSLQAAGNIRIGKGWDDTNPFIGDITCIQFYNTSLLGGTRRQTYDLCDPNLNTLPGDHTIDGSTSNTTEASSFSSSNGTKCYETCSTGNWLSWDICTESCGGGTRTRRRSVCCPTSVPDFTTCLTETCSDVIESSKLWENITCNELCYNGGIYQGSCQCEPGWTGNCCETRISCGSPSIPNKARIVVQDYYYSNLSAVVCDLGYAVTSGDAIRQCNSSGLWDGKTPICSLASWNYDKNGNNGSFNHLLLDKKSTSKQRRTLISIYESKPSKVFLGTCGIIILVVVCCYFVFMDGLSLLKKHKHLTQIRSRKNSPEVYNAAQKLTLCNDLERVSSREKLFHNRLRHKPRIRLINT